MKNKNDPHHQCATTTTTANTNSTHVRKRSQGLHLCHLQPPNTAPASLITSLTCTEDATRPGSKADREALRFTAETKNEIIENYTIMYTAQYMR